MTALTRIALPVAAAFLLGAGPAVPPPAPDPAAARTELAAEAYRLALAQHAAGAATLESVCLWSQRLAEAKKDWKGHADRMREVSAQAASRFQAGTGSRLDLVAAKYFLADAEARAAGR
jgi:hypothetical protein